jgi:hypothetical protein
MKTCSVIFLFLLIVSIWSCQSDETLRAFDAADDCPNCINFENLQVGQQSRYIAFRGNRDFEAQKWRYESDILVVKVAAQANDTFAFEEYLTSDPDSVRVYHVSISNDAINIHLPEYWNGSWLFQGGLNLHLSRSPSNPQPAQLKGWEAIVRCETAPCYGYFSEYKQLDFIYQDLYVYHNYGPMAWDGNGYFTIYNQKYGIVRSVSVGSWIPIGYGWDLIVE